MITSLVVGDEQELAFDGSVFYSGPALSLLAAIRVIAEHFKVDTGTAQAAFKAAKREVIR